MVPFLLTAQQGADFAASRIIPITGLMFALIATLRFVLIADIMSLLKEIKREPLLLLIKIFLDELVSAIPDLNGEEVRFDICSQVTTA
ncbi:hypothetical protein FALCPG4_018392 [Fusarium falciforme]